MTSFYNLLTTTVKENGLKTELDLHNFIDNIYLLPQPEREKYNLQITDIFNKIPDYVLNSSQHKQTYRVLSTVYRSELFTLIHNIIFKIDHNITYYSRKEIHTAYPFAINSSYTINTSKEQPKQSFKHDQIPEDYPTPVEIPLSENDKKIMAEIDEATKKQEEIKLIEWKNTDPVVTQQEITYKAVPEMINALRELIIGIRKNIVTNQVVEFVLVFEDINKFILAEHPNQSSISTLVTECLKENGWNVAGFYSDPDKSKLNKIAKELHQILELIA